MPSLAHYSSLSELLGDSVLKFKSNTALIEVDRDQEIASYSYLEFKKISERVARALEDKGTGAGDRVAILMSNQSKWLIAAYAAFMRGAVLVPLDYKLSPKELKALLVHARPKLMVTEYPIWKSLVPIEGISAVVTEVPSDVSLEGAERWETLAHTMGAPTAVKRARSDDAAIVYSSGTGGKPKGCVLTHDNYLEQYAALSKLYPLEENDRYFSILPTNHAIDFMCGFLGPLASGATVVHQRTLRPEFLVATMKRYRITHLAVVPLILAAIERAILQRVENQSAIKQRAFRGLLLLNSKLTARVPRPELSRRLLKPIHEAFGGHLKLLFCGGAFVDPRRAQFLYELGIPVVIGYGLTEACTVVTVNDLKPFRSDTVGKPIQGVEVDLRNVDQATDIGELWVRGPTVMREYFEDPEQTREVLQDGWLRTGDLGYFDAAHHLHLVGRSKNMIVTAGGKNIYPEDVENAFEGAPCEELAVFSTNYLWPGTSLLDEKLVAVVRQQVSDTEPLREALKERNRRLPDYKRLHGLIAWPDAFPRTASMKLKREPLAKSLREHLKPGDFLEL